MFAWKEFRDLVTWRSVDTEQYARSVHERRKASQISQMVGAMIGQIEADIVPGQLTGGH